MRLVSNRRDPTVKSNAVHLLSRPIQAWSSVQANRARSSRSRSRLNRPAQHQGPKGKVAEEFIRAVAITALSRARLTQNGVPWQLRSGGILRERANGIQDAHPAVNRYYGQ